MSCQVCNGLKTYPIINDGGKHLYDIECPECLGSGLTEEEAALARRQREDRARYEAAISEMRATNLPTPATRADPFGSRGAPAGHDSPIGGGDVSSFHATGDTE